MLPFIRRILAGSMLLLPPVLAFPDPPPPPPQVRQVFAGGQFVQFPINSFNKYTNGMELNDWTRVRVKISHLPEGVAWRYRIYADKDSFKGDMTSNKLKLDYLQIQINFSNLTFDPINIDFDDELIELSQTPHIFVNGTGNGEFDVLVSYKMGTDTEKPLLREIPDYYFLDLIFQLETDIP